MLIDKLEKNGVLNFKKSQEPIIFYVDEFVNIYSKPRYDKDKDIILASYLPFDKMAINFTNSVLLLDQSISEDGDVKICGIFYFNGLNPSPIVYNDFLGNFMCSMGGGIYIEDMQGRFSEYPFNEPNPEKDNLSFVQKESNFMAKNLMVGIVSNLTHFLSCKNITYEQEHPPAKLQKSRAKKGKPPLSSYYVLKLKPTTTKRDYEARNLWTNRVHLCRGHVREYTEERPLFGKYAGRFWIPPHARGDKKQGVIHKDYQLETTET